MSKGKIITFSIITFIVLLNIVLFGFVFVLKKQSVEFVDNLNIPEEEIIKTANLKNGKSTLLLDKQSAIENIEKTYSKVKVIQIETVSLFEIKIVVRPRYELYYVAANSKFFILDEDLKVLEITDTEPTELIKVSMKLNLDDNTQKCDFIGTDKQQENLLNLYIAMYSAVIDSNYKQASEDICDKIISVDLEDNKIIVLTRNGVTLDIAKPQEDLTNKINLCFSTINKLEEEGKDVLGKTIKIFYEAEGKEYKCYLLSSTNN